MELMNNGILTKYSRFYAHCIKKFIVQFQYFEFNNNMPIQNAVFILDCAKVVYFSHLYRLRCYVAPDMRDNLLVPAYSDDNLKLYKIYDVFFQFNSISQKQFFVLDDSGKRNYLLDHTVDNVFEMKNVSIVLPQ
ncbi:hypothetical protein RFI_12899 [Reticulomyxa filosa]|uniref:Uncharacterized protein n=1 Tax=Reticulomyxa filosa TaxID=46433 RepID=X6NER7_RETFI|nr:hypothetical protein RFI_12899 [Reticulomyxa filosa]|eukprot:ETO24259.1 hypothetical protein RFI_12899 [Reticulomyxa filosa]